MTRRLRTASYGNPSIEQLEAEIAEEAERVRRANAWKELDALRAENVRLAKAFADSEAACLIQVQMVRAEIERLRAVERAARAAVETQRTLGYVSLTLLADVLEELDRHKRA